MLRLKRSKTSVGDLVLLDADLNGRSNALPARQLPARQEAAARAREKRGFSLTKLTSSLGLQKTTPSKTVDKSAISGPIIDPNNPVIPPSPTVELGEVSPPPPATSPYFYPSYTRPPVRPAPSRSLPREYLRVSSTGHLHSVSEPANLHSVSEPTNFQYPPPSRLPPPIPFATNTSITEPRDSAIETPLVHTPESPYDSARVFEYDKPIRASLPWQPSSIMDPSRLSSRISSRFSLQPPPTGTKARAIQQAKDMQQLVAERAKRSGYDAPPYEFYELIGKGAYGRVFKGLNRRTGGMVAIKIIDIDSDDYERMETTGLSDTLREINILQQLGDSRARPYVNIIEEARAVHNELWIVSEYASGGSIATLMKPTMGKEHQGLQEWFIIPIARELALGLKYTHEAGVLHRDLKCNNVLILEDGRVQLCDFGVSGMLEPSKSKRSTIVGTPNWMAPELQKEFVKAEQSHNMDALGEILYGSEVDIWAYACTIYEMATGLAPHQGVRPLDLPYAGVPVLEGERYSQKLKDFIAFVFQPEPENRPTPDEILQHPFIADSTKKYPTVMLVKLVEDYYKWEHEGGSRISLFNPGGARAPEALVPEDDDDEDDDWTFSTSNEFENRISRAFSADPFTMPDQGYTGMNVSSETGDRWKQMKAVWHEQSVNRGKEILGGIFNQNSTPYNYNGSDGGNGRPPSDLVLRDFENVGSRITVIDLDLAAPTSPDVPTIDLGEVPTLKANRLHRSHSDLQEEEERDKFDMDDLATKRATRDWKFPMVDDQYPMPVSQEKRSTMGWKFPAADDDQIDEPVTNTNRETRDFQFPPPPPPKPNRATREWTFSAAMAEANYQAKRNSRRETRDWKFPTVTEKTQVNRKTQDFVFPMSESVEEESDQSQDSYSFFPPSLRHATTEPLGSFGDYPTINSAPQSPIRNPMIDLDMAMIDDYRPSTADSSSTTIHTAVSEQLNDNPFNLEDQVQLSQNNNRASYHTKSQSEPNHAIPGLLTPQNFDEQGQPTNLDPHHPNMHARGVSSVSQMQAQLKPPVISNGLVHHRPYQRSQQLAWEGWSHSVAYGIGSDDSPPTSVTTDLSVDDDDIDEAWDVLEKQMVSRHSSHISHISRTMHRINASRDEDPRSSDTDEADYEDFPRPIRVSLGPNGKPLVEFPVPRGPDPEALLGVSGVGGGDTDLQNALWKSTVELRDGLRASRDLMKAMRLEDVRPLEDFEGNGTGNGMRTVRQSRGISER
jgi:protein-serine/threonine kinase